MAARGVLGAVALVGALAGAVAGLRWLETRPIESAAGQAPAQAADESGGAFALKRCAVQPFDERPALTLVFSQPLDPADATLDKLLRVIDLGPLEGRDGAEQGTQSMQAPAALASPASGAAPSGRIVPGHWVIDDNARIAYFAAVQPQRRYRVELAAALKSVDGDTLSAAGHCELALQATPPAFYFASRGTVLPAGQNGGLPIVVVNTPEVDVQFLRVLPQALPRFLERVGGAMRSGGASDDGDDGGGYDAGGSLQGSAGAWQLDQWKALTEPVHLARYATPAPTDQRRTHHLPVEHIAELQQPGVYIAVMSEPGRFGKAFQVTHFHVSDIGLQLQRQGQQLSAFTTSLRSGKALAGLRVELLDAHGRVRAQASTDADGHARFTAVPADAVLAAARQGQSMSLLRLAEPGLDLSEFDVGGHASRSLSLFAYAGRDLYRPGERVTLSVLARDVDGRRLPSLMPLQATLKRPDGRTVSQESWLFDERKQPGYLQRPLLIPADAQTGRWSLELRHDPASEQPTTVWRFQVEEFLPERMKLELRAAEGTLAPGQAFAVKVQGDYLYGAPAAGNRLIVLAAAERQREALPKQWPGFYFGDVADDGRRSRQPVSDAALDERGAAEITLPAPEGVASPMRVTGSFSLLESGGRPVVRSIERTLWPADKLIALRPLFDRDVAGEGAQAGFELIRLSADGKPHPLKAAQLKLVREDRQYHWRFDEQRGWQSGFVETEEKVLAKTLDLGSTRTRVDLPVQWGRYRVDIHDAETGQTLRYRFYAGWGAQEAERIGNRPDRVKLQWAGGKRGAPFTQGDTATLQFTPPHDGEALVSVMSGEKLLWVRRVSSSAAGSSVEIPIGSDADWARHDLYATVTAFRPGSQGDRVTPARAVGLLHLPLNRAERQLKLSLSAPAKTEPERRVAVKLKVEGAKPAGAEPVWVTLSAVDVGILNITRYASPDPADFFFGKQRFAPEWLDVYGKLIEKLDGSLARMRWGGDAASRDTQSLPKKVKLVDLFAGPVALDAQGEATVMLDIPDFNGQLRLMAVAFGAERFGKAQAELTSVAPIVAELSTPRFIAPGDQAQIALDVTNLSGQAQTVSVRLQGESPLKLSANSGPVQLKHQERQVLRFPVEAVAPYGLARILLEVQTASGIKIRREAALQVQPPFGMERDGRRARLAQGESLRIAPELVSRFHAASSQVSMAVSDQPPLNLGRLVQGLLDYPYGCLEQTTSGAYPHLFVDEAAAKAWGLKPRSLAERQQAVDAALGRIAGLQGSQGGFSLWGGSGGSRFELYLSAYVLGFLQDAKAAGFRVPEALQSKAVAWMQGELAQAPNRFPTLPKELRFDRQAQGGTASFNQRDYELVRDSHRRFAELAHIGYQLAREQKAPLSTLRYLHDSVRDRSRSPLPLVHLALALKLMGDERRSQEALNDAMQRAYGILPRQTAQAWGWWWDEWLGDYGSAVRDNAMAYALLHRHGVDHARREQLLFDAADRVGSRRWSSTQEKIALVQAARAAGGLKRDGPWSALLQVAELKQALSSRSTEMRSFEAGRLAQGVQLTNQGASPLFVELEGSGFPLQAPEPRSDVIELKRDWLEPDGRPWTGRSLRVGEMLLVRLQARSKTPIKDALLVDAVPAGLEIENLNLSQGALELMVSPELGQQLMQAGMDGRIRHREFRDDRYVAAAALDGNWVSVWYLLRVVSPGRFGIPAPQAEDMYRPELRGVGARGGVVVVEEGGR